MGASDVRSVDSLVREMDDGGEPGDVVEHAISQIESVHGEEKRRVCRAIATTLYPALARLSKSANMLDKIRILVLGVILWTTDPQTNLIRDRIVQYAIEQLFQCCTFRGEAAQSVHIAAGQLIDIMSTATAVHDTIVAAVNRMSRIDRLVQRALRNLANCDDSPNCAVALKLCIFIKERSLVPLIDTAPKGWSRYVQHHELAPLMLQWVTLNLGDVETVQTEVMTLYEAFSAHAIRMVLHAEYDHELLFVQGQSLCAICDRMGGLDAIRSDASTLAPTVVDELYSLHELDSRAQERLLLLAYHVMYLLVDEDQASALGQFDEIHGIYPLVFDLCATVSSHESRTAMLSFFHFLFSNRNPKCIAQQLEHVRVASRDISNVAMTRGRSDLPFQTIQEEQKAQIDFLTTEVESIRQRLAASNASYSKLQTEYKDLFSSSEALKKRNASLEHECVQHQQTFNNNEKLSSANHKLKHDNMALQHQYDLLKEVETKQGDKIESLCDMLMRLTDMYESREQIHADSEQKIQSHIYVCSIQSDISSTNRKSKRCFKSLKCNESARRSSCPESTILSPPILS